MTQACEVQTLPLCDNLTPAVNTLIQSSFGSLSQRLHRAAVRLREHQLPMMWASFVAYQKTPQDNDNTPLTTVKIDHILGSIQVYPVVVRDQEYGSSLSTKSAPAGNQNKNIVGVYCAPLLGPLAVDPYKRGRGIGFSLVRKTLASLDDVCPCVLCIGDPGYYAMFGFFPASACALTIPPSYGETAPLMLLLRHNPRLTQASNTPTSSIGAPKGMSEGMSDDRNHPNPEYPWLNMKKIHNDQEVVVHNMNHTVAPSSD